MESRRNFIKILAATGFFSTVPSVLLSSWGTAQNFLECYTSKMSAAPGESVVLHISTNCKKYAIAIRRIGAAPQIVWTKKGLTGKAYKVPSNMATHGCDWPAAVQVNIPATWASGIYAVALTGEGGDKAIKNESFFIVRPSQPGKNADILFQVSTNTYQAYNGKGGSSLYSGPNFPRVSFNRPLNIFEQRFFLEGVGESINPNTNCFHTWDEPFIIWAEKEGYKIDYCANLDLEFHPELLTAYKLVLSVGHDEYWSWGMRDAIETFVQKGGNAAFFSGNTCCWQVRPEDEGRSLVCYKMAHEKDPVFHTPDRSKLTTLWGHPIIGRPENEMTGVGYTYGGYNGFFNKFKQGEDAGTYVVHQPDHWVFKNTGLKKGDRFGKLKANEQPGIAGYECDGCEFVMESGVPVATGRDGTPKNMHILATAKAQWAEVDSSVVFATNLRKLLPQPENGQAIPEDPINAIGSGVLGLYEKENGGTVLTVGATDWPYGLAEGDAITRQIVKNILDKLTT